MKHALKTQAGKKAYCLRKPNGGAGFGFIKSLMRFRQFLMRGLAHVRNK